MNCKETRYQLPDFVLDKLSEQEKIVVAGHLSSCRECQAEAEQLHGVFTETKRSMVWAPSENYFSSLLPRVHRRIEEKVSRGIPNWLTQFALPVAAATVFIIVLMNVVPASIGRNEFELNAVLQQLQPEELQDAVDHQLSATILESSAVVDVQTASSLSDDKEIVQEILQNEDKPYSYSEFSELDTQSSLENISDRDADELASIFEHKFLID